MFPSLNTIIHISASCEVWSFLIHSTNINKVSGVFQALSEMLSTQRWLACNPCPQGYSQACAENKEVNYSSVNYCIKMICIGSFHSTGDKETMY